MEVVPIGKHVPNFVIAPTTSSKEAKKQSGVTYRLRNGAGTSVSEAFPQEFARWERTFATMIALEAQVQTAVGVGATKLLTQWAQQLMCKSGARLDVRNAQQKDAIFKLAIMLIQDPRGRHVGAMRMFEQERLTNAGITWRFTVHELKNKYQIELEQV